MAVKTFTTGEVLTTADTNTYLNNGGLVYIKQTDLSGTAVNITSCFSASYDSYLLVLSNLTNSAGAVLLQFQMLSGTTPANGANYNYTRLTVGGGAVTQTSATAQTQGSMSPFGTTKSAQTVTIYSPYQTVRTLTRSTGNYDANANLAYVDDVASVHDVNTSYDGIRLISAANNFSTGKAIIYGYRQS